MTALPAKKKKKGSILSKCLAWLHLWMGLISGIVVFIIAVTGCLFVFQKEIMESIHHQTYFVTPTHTAPLPLSTLLDNAQKALGTAKPANYITAYIQPNRAWEFMSYAGNDTATTYFGTLQHYESVFINPYNGAVTGRIDYKYNFFNIVKGIHWSLLLNDKYGQPIIGWSTFIFIILLITGLVLWWPKKWNKAARKQNFRIKWGASFKRLNYDLHNVLGFYSLLIALVLALTGMVWAFKWFEATVYVIAARSTTPPVFQELKSAKPTTPPVTNPLDIAFKTAQLQMPDAQRYGVSPAPTPEGVINVHAFRGKEVYYDHDEADFDQYTGKMLHKQTEKEKNGGVQMIELNYDIHVGAVGGIAGKIIAFIVGLICASLPITGFLVWWGKNHHKKYQKPATRASVSATTV
ncbi:PepSY domain-containing protein [Chitinophaga pendula]|uniref:PepSY-associated TM helix domain-containing protein n=1 Tax=Chitinophaga TaxID=79328 RepID=UPI000BB0A13A|nr:MULTISPECIES: PepSY-associated TM helix domain-containing protein [Chitinophaga]ASZ11733.1 hypothetical protein CK934_12580 [Chitinophaga sp. MD30]UCJ05247.1 PepSY domain-containing protein [Chitinophaga pendula]